jgi:hypothetical protein
MKRIGLGIVIENYGSKYKNGASYERAPYKE